MTILDARGHYAMTCLSNCPHQANISAWIASDLLATAIADTLVASSDSNDQVVRLDALRANLETAAAAIPLETPAGPDAAHTIALAAIVPLLTQSLLPSPWCPERDGAIDFLLAKLRQDHRTDSERARAIVADALTDVRNVIRALAAA